MNEENPIPPRPDDTHATAPHTPPATASQDAGSQASVPQDTSRRSWLRRPLVIAGGAVVAAVVLAGGGVAIGAAIADEFGDDEDTAESVRSGSDDGAATQRDRDDRDDRPDAGDDAAASGSAAGSESAGSTSVGAVSAAELSDVIAAAASVASGDAVSIEAERDGAWDVTFENADGDSEVRVAADGTATLVSSDPADADDRPAAGLLDEATVAALVEAALAHTDGRIVELDVDDDTVSPYDASVVGADSRTVELSFDADLAVLAADVDD